MFEYEEDESNLVLLQTGIKDTSTGEFYRMPASKEEDSWLALFDNFKGKEK